MTQSDSNPPHWNPRIYLWDGGFLGIGRSEGTVPPHAHHALQVVLSLEDAFRLREPGEEWSWFRGAIVRADAPHSFDGSGYLGAMLFVDPESQMGRWLTGSLTAPITEIPEERLEASLPTLRRLHEDPPDAPSITGLVVSMVRSLCVGPPPLRRIDSRILRALERIHRADATRLSIDEVARSVFLSPSRFAHLFRDEVGLPFRRYLLWRKLTRSLLVAGRGNTLTAAAHAGGFADSAHLTRTCYQMFGIAPSILLGGGDYFEIPAPFEIAEEKEREDGAA